MPNNDNINEAKNQNPNTLLIQKTNINNSPNITPPNNNLHFFHINNLIENKKLIHKPNKIITTKYNFFTFLPKALLFQFMRLANIYFLIIAIIQCIPLISPLSPSTAIAPIVFVLTVSLIREGLEDFARNSYDKFTNYEKVQVFRDNKWQEVKSQDLLIGEIIIVKEDKSFPADLILIDTSLDEGICYIETATLDGEKTLKFKKSHKDLANKLKNSQNKKQNLQNFSINGECNCDLPSDLLYKLDGTIKVTLETNNTITNTICPLDSKQLLLKGAILKNTEWAIGIVVYTGHKTKLMLNSKKGRIKFSTVEKLMTKFLIAILILQTIICVICAVLYGIYFNYYIKANKILNIFSLNFIIESVLKYFTYLLLLNTMIPISLIITLEIAKVFQGYFIAFDVKMYSLVRKKFTKAGSVSLNEELGQVDYIFSDKTGTLTCNKMKFKYCVIADVCYEFIREEELKELPGVSKKKNIDNKFLEEEKFREENQIKTIYPMHLKKLNTGSEFLKKSTYEDFLISSSSSENGKTPKVLALETNLKIHEEYFKALAINNECVVNIKNGVIEYSGLSPDDIELVSASAHLGCQLLKSESTKEKKIKIFETEEKKYEILNSIEFTSDRKKSSVIIRDGEYIKLYIKGADSEILKILSKNSSKSFLEESKKFVDVFSKQGYRTLLVGMKIFNEEEFNILNNSLNEINLSSAPDKNKLLDDLHIELEKDIYLLGATIVEDKLQDSVPETIRDLRLAGIKIWMLTGDKIDTAENIGKSCNLISEELKLFKLNKEKNNTYEDFVENFGKYLENHKISFEDYTKKTKENLPEYSILVDLQDTKIVFQDEKKQANFINISKYAKSVICSRCSPGQKSEVVRMIKQSDNTLVSLSIGDGGNDVPMITEAHIGVGVYGEEGMMAVQSSDFAIGEFKFLRRLLLFHGRTNYMRISEMILYFFYKNFVFTIIHFYFGFYNNFSGQTIIDDWFISLYNMIFTCFPLGARSVIDHDIHPNDGKAAVLYQTFLYDENKKNPKFNILSFLFEIFRGLLHGLINFYGLYFVLLQSPVDRSGNIADMWFFSVNCYTNIIFIVSINLIIKSKYITLFNFFIMIILSWGLYFAFIYWVHVSTMFNSNSTMYVAFTSAKLYLTFVIIVGVTSMIDYALYAGNMIFNKSTLNILLRERKKNGCLENHDLLPKELEKYEKKLRFFEGINPISEKPDDFVELIEVGRTELKSDHKKLQKTDSKNNDSSSKFSKESNFIENNNINNNLNKNNINNKLSSDRDLYENNQEEKLQINNLNSNN